MARYRRMQGDRVLFLTGTDEHGWKIEQKAKEAGMEPQAYVDRLTDRFRKLWDCMSIQYDRFVRTTDAYHVQTVQSVFQKLYDRGYIYKGEYIGLYCTPCESFWTPKQVVNGKCPDCGREVTDAQEEAYFFQLSTFTEKIGDFLKNGTFLQPKERALELLNNFIRPGLEDLCVSRTGVSWGISVPFDPKHTVYVWADALFNYLSALGYENARFSDWETFWPAQLHLVAKDIMRFHAIVWPALLMALDLPLPKQLAVHGWITVEGKKMSKSVGNVIDPYVLTKLYGVDAVRYHLLRELALGCDYEFSSEVMARRIDSDLSNGLGNLVSRTVAMVEKYFGGTLPVEREIVAADSVLIDAVCALRKKVDAAIDAVHLKEALAEIFAVVAMANQYVDANAPWRLAKQPESRARLATVLYHLLETLRIVSGLLAPFMPNTMPKIWEQIGAAPTEVAYDPLQQWGVLPPAISVKKGAILFPKIETGAKS